MSRGKGLRAAGWVAEYIRPWWPDAAKTPNSLPGADIENTPPVRFEIKTGAQWSHKAIAQAAGYAGPGELPLVVYLPPGCGERSVGDALVVVPLRVIMPVLVDGEWAPEPDRVELARHAIRYGPLIPGGPHVVQDR